MAYPAQWKPSTDAGWLYVLGRAANDGHGYYRYRKCQNLFASNKEVREVATFEPKALTGYFRFAPFPENLPRSAGEAPISNLIGNAVKYSPKGKEIGIKCEIIGNVVQVSITDESMGINPHHQEKLFDRYFRIQSANTQQISGFGIGLYLSAEIVERHSGKIWVKSELGVGSTFYFSLPIDWSLQKRFACSAILIAISAGDNK